jgi:cell division protein FtsB
MAPQKAYIERDRHGRQRIVIEKKRRGSATSSRPSTQDLLDAAIRREEELIIENNALRATLSGSQRDSWEHRNLTVAYQNLVNEHNHCGYLRAQLEAQVRETQRLEDRLDDEKDKSEKLAHKNHSLADKIEKLEDKLHDMRSRIAERDRTIIEHEDIIRLNETRINDKNKVIIYLKQYLRDHGFRVD